MEWFAKGTNILTDPRTWAFADAIGASVPTASGHLDGVYGLLAKAGDEHGRIDLVPDAMLEHVAMWTGEPGRFAAAFRAHYQDPDGTLHRWRDWNGAQIINARRMRDKKRRYRDERRQSLHSEGDSPRDRDGDSPGDSPGDAEGGPTPGPASIQDLTRQDKTRPTTTPLTTPRTRKPRESRPEGDAAARHTWLTPIGRAWEARYGPGSFPYGQAARELKPLIDAGHTSEEIARRLTWYLSNKGCEDVLPPEQLARISFRPNLRDFRMRFGQFDPSAETPL